MESLDNFVAYDHLLVEPFEKRGWSVEHIPWRGKRVNWNRFDVVIVRSTWDYHHTPDQFMAALETIEASKACLENSLSMIRWNLDKRYLQDLEDENIPIVPTKWLSGFSGQNTDALFGSLDTEKIVIKPVIGAGSDDTFWITPKSSASTLRQIEEVFTARPAMLQPFMENITSEGEFSLFYFDGDYSHTVLKTPESGDFRVQEEHGGRLKLVEAESHLKQTGDKIMKALPEIPLYARVDIVRTQDNNFALMELELIEPSLYFNMDENSPDRFAEVFVRRMKRN